MSSRIVTQMKCQRDTRLRARVEVLLSDINTLDTGGMPLRRTRDKNTLARAARGSTSSLCHGTLPPHVTPMVYTNAAAAPGTFYRAEEPISSSHSWVTLPFRAWGEPFGQSVSFTFVIKRLSERLRAITMRPARDTPPWAREYGSPLSSNVSNGRLKGYRPPFLLAPPPSIFSVNGKNLWLLSWRDEQALV